MEHTSISRNDALEQFPIEKCHGRWKEVPESAELTTVIYNPQYTDLVWNRDGISVYIGSKINNPL